MTIGSPQSAGFIKKQQLPLSDENSYAKYGILPGDLLGTQIKKVVSWGPKVEVGEANREEEKGKLRLRCSLYRVVLSA
jgi:hypothetical protein